MHTYTYTRTHTPTYVHIHLHRMLYGSVIRGWGSRLTHTYMHIHIHSYTYIQTQIWNTRSQLVKWWGSGLSYTHVYTRIKTHIHTHIHRMLHGSVICRWGSGLLSPRAYRKCQAKTSGGKCLYSRMYVSIHVHMHVDMWVYVQIDFTGVYAYVNNIFDLGTCMYTHTHILKTVLDNGRDRNPSFWIWHISSKAYVPIWHLHTYVYISTDVRIYTYIHIDTLIFRKYF